jgi:hypothetical protein
MRDTAIRNVHSNVATINAETTAWDGSGNIVVLDEAAIATEVARLQTEHDSQEYARLRKAAYPSIEECVHSILDDDLVALQAKRAEVKARFPK